MVVSVHISHHVCMYRQQAQAKKKTKCPPVTWRMSCDWKSLVTRSSPFPFSPTPATAVHLSLLTRPSCCHCLLPRAKRLLMARLRQIAAAASNTELQQKLARKTTSNTTKKLLTLRHVFPRLIAKYQKKSTIIGKLSFVLA